jgi:hypothetical protein
MTDVLGFTGVPTAEPALDHTLVEIARARRVQRDRIVATHESVTISMVADAHGTSEAAARQWLYRHRAAGRLVSVEHGGAVLIPSFQLDTDAHPRPDVAPIVARMVKAGMSGWSVWTWWVTDNGWLERAPIDALDAGDDTGVAEAADRMLDPVA